MLLSTPIDYSLPEDERAEKVLRAIQDRERNFQTTYTKDLYVKFSGMPEEKILSINTVKHEWIDNRIDRLKNRNFIEKIADDKDRRRVELRTKPEEIYTQMIIANPTLFWNLIGKGYFYFIIRFRETNDNVVCPMCHKSQPFNVSFSKNKASRYKVSDELHVDVVMRHLILGFKCGCGYSYSDEVDMYDPLTLEDFSRLYGTANSRRNLL